MKARVTKHEMKSRFDKIVCIGYEDAARLLKYRSEIAYSVRAEGWACDYYIVDGVLISTGYAPLKSVNTHSNYDIVRKYNDKATAIAMDYDLGFEEQKEQIEKLLHEYIQEVTQ